MIVANLYYMRSWKDRISLPLADFAHRYGVTPNVVTGLGLLLGIASGVSLAHRAVPFALLLLFVSVFCDVLDGTVARTFRAKTAFGLAFDSVADRCTELSVVVGALFSGIIYPIGSVAIIGSITLHFMRTLSYLHGFDTNYVLFGRAERIVFISLGLIAPSTSISTFCFVMAGVFGLLSSCQVGISLWHQRTHLFRV